MNQTQNAQKHPIFNNQYEILKSLGEGNTSKVYLARSIQDASAKQVAIKILKEEFLRRDEDSILSVQNEITILKNLNNAGIIRMLDFGDAGQVVKPSGRVISNLVFIVMEYVAGGLLFDLCQTMGAMGEDAGRFFMTQMVNSLDYMHNLRCVHRDLKLENILVDDQLNLKIADFGFACYKSIDQLKSYRGTMTYMAPEIKEGKTYDGTQVDLFSVGVIIFIIVQGIFPFKEARKEEYFYNLLLTGQIETYFEKVNGTGLSADFKDMILKLFSYDGKNRYTVEQLKAHPFLNKPDFNMEETRQKLVGELHARQQAAKPDPFKQQPVKVKRGNTNGVMA